MNTATPTSSTRITSLVDAIADRLTAPPTPPPPPEQAQSLADGAAGISLLHIERALAGTGDRATAHDWLRAVVHGGVLATRHSGLYRGAPAVAFVLHIAAGGDTSRYAAARQALDRTVSTLTHDRVDQALARIARAELPAMAEYDIINGLTGIGAHLLRHAPHDEALPRVLAYLVRLTEPLHHDGMTLPGWWTAQDPHATISTAFPGGHANLGLAHGITGPLALLALAKQRGITVDGHVDAIERVCSWLDTWRQQNAAGTWWPQWVTHQDRRMGQPAQLGPLRPSWCYGTPGLARAQQLAGLAIGDLTRQRVAEQALTDCLADPGQLAHVSDLSLCHGWAGLFLTAWHTANNAITPATSEHLPQLAAELLYHAGIAEATGDGLLEGHAGAALTLHAVVSGTPPMSGWDACLLIT